MSRCGRCSLGGESPPSHLERRVWRVGGSGGSGKGTAGVQGEQREEFVVIGTGFSGPALWVCYAENSLNSVTSFRSTTQDQQEADAVPETNQVSRSLWRKAHIQFKRWSSLAVAGAVLYIGQAASSGWDPPAEGAGMHGSNSFGGASGFGVGGSGAEGVPLMTGGASAPLLCEDDAPIDVLFIGNSYTHYYQMPELFSAMAESAGCSVRVDYVAPGGSKLNEHAKSSATLSAIGSRDWDVVVLQNFSQLPSQPLSYVKEKTLPSVVSLANAVFENNPESSLFYYVTWGRRDGDKDFCQKSSEVCSFMGHTEALYRGYSLYRETTGGAFADVGGAFANIYRERRKPFSFRELYDADGSHPSLKGSYLAASVFFASVFKASPEGLAYPQGLSRASAEYIQKVAGRLPISGA